MAVTEDAAGSQTATIDTEHTLSTRTAAGMYVLHVDVSAMVLGDELTLRAKTRARTTDTTRVAYVAESENIPTELIMISPVIAIAGGECVFTLEQTLGTGRAFPWAVLKLD